MLRQTTQQRYLRGPQPSPVEILGLLPRLKTARQDSHVFSLPLNRSNDKNGACRSAIASQRLEGEVAQASRSRYDQCRASTDVQSHEGDATATRPSMLVLHKSNPEQLEASEGRRRIIAILAAHKQQSEGVTIYSTSQIDESIMDAEVRHIYENAQAVTRPLYELGQDSAQPENPNWIIRWMLWHVFRYRDGRQKTRSDSTSAALTVRAFTANELELGDNEVPEVESDSVASSFRQYFDPVRDRLVGRQATPETR
ncbi:hypothetical protein AC579_894 [Pseudocercospora musae]|uniref:Uncharacterized protein n=1 Tax=Pseudocercospora musae TaxID=113226 RepID=A0A139IND4_9PEZI|nr:hypothetical protein AC579_894 [Pseudocercospora musae]